MTCNILGNDDIPELLKDGRNSELSDFTDEKNINFQFNFFIICFLLNN